MGAHNASVAEYACRPPRCLREYTSYQQHDPSGESPVDLHLNPVEIYVCSVKDNYYVHMLPLHILHTYDKLPNLRIHNLQRRT